MLADCVACLLFATTVCHPRGLPHLSLYHCGSAGCSVSLNGVGERYGAHACLLARCSTRSALIVSQVDSAFAHPCMSSVTKAAPETETGAGAQTLVSNGVCTAGKAADSAVDKASDKPYTFSCRVAYDSHEDATMLQKALSVDPELRPALVTRSLSVKESTLIMNFAAADARTLRSAVGTFCDLLGLATRTLETFEKVAR